MLKFIIGPVSLLLQQMLTSHCFSNTHVSPSHALPFLAPILFLCACYTGHDKAFSRNNFCYVLSFSCLHYGLNIIQNSTPTVVTFAFCEVQILTEY